MPQVQTYYPPSVQNQMQNDYKLALAKQLQANAINNEPVTTPIGALAKVLSAGLGKYAQNKQMEEYDTMASNRKADMTVFMDEFNRTGDINSALQFAPEDLQEPLTMALIKQKVSGSDMPANIQEWQYYSQLPQTEQEAYLQMKRNPQFLNLGGQYVQPGLSGQAPVQSFQKTPPPEQMPDFKGQQALAQEQGKQQVRMVTEPYIAGEQARARQEAEISTAAQLEAEKLRGRGETPQTEKTRKFQGQVTSTLQEAANLYKKLDEMGAAINVENKTMDNISAAMRASDTGQALGRAMGTDEQSIRNRINQLRPTLMSNIRQATEMGAKGLDSEKELEFYLQAVSDPKRDIQSNMAALKVLNDAYGLGGELKGVKSGAIDKLKKEQSERGQIKELNGKQYIKRPDGNWYEYAP